MFVSVAARILLNIEALNMIESIGNVIRHRRAPIVVPTEEGYTLTYVPAISGECLAYSYQSWLSKLIKPVCENCERGFYVKHGVRELFKDKGWEKEIADKISKAADLRRKKNPQWLNLLHEIEKELIINCAVEDIGGFLLPEEAPVKRTSRFQISPMIPSLEEVRQAALEAQFHVRYAPDPKYHAIYYTETGSALHSFQFQLDIDGIGYTSFLRRELAVNESERDKRIQASLDALAHMLESGLFGGHLSRCHPIMDIRSCVITLSESLPFVATSGNENSYIRETCKRAEAFEKLTNKRVWIWAVVKEKMEVPEKAKVVATIFDAIMSVKEKIRTKEGGK